MAAVIGDVAGHGIEPAITAFQAKYLLRVFLRQYRDPAQALEELNAQMAAMGRGEEFISLCVIVFDTAGRHPAVLRRPGIRRRGSGTNARYDRCGPPGPLLMLDPAATYYSREIPLESNDLCLLYTDGLSEVRNGSQLFGEERIATAAQA